MVTKLDYIGICLLTMASPFGTINYSLACDELSMPRNFLTTICIVFGTFTIVVLMSPVFQRPDTVVLRSVVFVGLGVAVCSPVVYLARLENV